MNKLPKVDPRERTLEEARRALRGAAANMIELYSLSFAEMFMLLTEVLQSEAAAAVTLERREQSRRRRRSIEENDQ
jgi:hypothetical protein